MKKSTRRVGAGILATLAPSALAIAEGIEEKLYESPKEVINFDYHSKVRDDTNKFVLRSNGTVTMYDSNFNYIMNSKGDWFHDADNSKDVSRGDGRMLPEFDATITNAFKQGLIEAKEELGRNYAENEKLLEKIALAEGKLSKTENNVTDYMNEIQKLKIELRGYQTPSDEKEFPYASGNGERFHSKIVSKKEDHDIVNGNTTIINEGYVTPTDTCNREEVADKEIVIQKLVDEEEPVAKLIDKQILVVEEKLPEPPINEDILKIMVEKYGLPESEVQEPVKPDYNSRLAFVTEGFGGKGFGVGGIGTSWEPSANFGLTGTILGGLAKDNTSEITTDPSPIGVYGHGITEEQGQRMIGGALEFDLRADNGLGILIGGEFKYWTWIENNTAEILGPDGEIRKSNSTSTPKNQISGGPRVGLEYITKSGAGFGIIASVDTVRNQISVGGRVSLRKSQNKPKKE